MDFQKDSVWKASVDSIPDGVRALMAEMPGRARAAVPEAFLRKVKNIVMTGCGDSLCAALAAREAFETMTGLRVDTPSCLEFSRHYHKNRFGAPGETLVLIISTSGRVSRCVEAALRARRNGAIAVAVTANNQSDLARSCDFVLDVTLAEIKSDALFGARDYATAPGSRNYVGSALALETFAAEMGRQTGALSAEEQRAFYDAVEKLNAQWEALLPDLNRQIAAAAEDFNRCGCFEALGAGAEFAAAWFTQAKAFEAINQFAKYENFEDWSHVDYFLRDRSSGIFLFCMQNNPSFSRCREVEAVLHRQQYRYFIITDAAKETFKGPERVLTVPSCPFPFLSAIYESLVGCIVFDYLQRLRGTGYYCGDLADSWFPIDGLILRNSEIREV